MRVEENTSEIYQQAERVFGDHVLEVLQGEGPVRLYACKKQNVRFYGFHVAAAPGMLTLYGDIGYAVLSVNSSHPEEWLCSSIDYRDYVIDKIRAGKERVYYQEKIDNFYKPMEPDVVEEIQCRLEEGEDLATAIFRVTGDLETDSILTGWSSDTLWIYEALRCFMRLYIGRTSSTEVPKNENNELTHH